MAVPRLVSLFCLLAVSSHVRVTSFSIGKRATRSVDDVTQALSILQRQRRRTGSDGYFNSERLLSNRPLDIDEISEWLSSRNDPSEQEEWTAYPDNFEQIDPRDRDMYGMGSLTFGDNPLAETDVNSEELKNIFEKGEDENEELNEIFNEDDDPNLEMKKRNKEEPLNVAGSEKEEKRSSSQPTDLSLDSLTQEELNVLMKAVKKINQQQSKRSTLRVRETIEHQSPSGDDTVSDVKEIPANEDELEDVFGDSELKPSIIQGKEITTEEEMTPLGQVTKTVEKEYVPDPEEEEEDRLEMENDMLAEIAKDLENEAEEEEEAQEDEFNPDVDETPNATDIKVIEGKDQDSDVDDNDDESILPEKAEIDPEMMEALDEQYWLMKNYKQGTSKRTSKRSVYPAQDLITDNLLGDQYKRSSDIIRDSDVMDRPLGAGQMPTVKMFVDKIIKLQDELDRLRTITKLEDIENDQLTDALDEATLAQGRGSVSRVEFDALQQAIQIEQAIQKLKGEGEGSVKRPVVAVSDSTSLADKLGESWRRKRGSSHYDVRSADPPRISPSFALQPVKRREPTLDETELGNLLAEALLLQNAADGEEDDDDDVTDDGGDFPSDDIASLFLARADECPAVRRYSTNCELADLYSLPVDTEARALCNLHEMCYACGNSLSVGQAQCDSLYREAAVTLCDEDLECVRQADVFLRTMKLKTRYAPHNQPTCQSSCTARFLGLI